MSLNNFYILFWATSKSSHAHVLQAGWVQMFRHDSSPHNIHYSGTPSLEERIKNKAGKADIHSQKP